MSFAYNTHTDSERLQMLKEIGLEKMDDLFKDIPAKLKLKAPLNLPPAMKEWDLKKKLTALAAKNTTTQNSICLLGQGAYEHYIPAVVEAICSRGEFLTSYTPYQPEMSQGLLQILFEYQTMIARLSGLNSVNCSMYDGATGFAEAAWMACQIKNRRKILVSENISEQYKQVLKTYMYGRDVHIDWIPAENASGSTALSSSFSKGQYAAVMIQTPNQYGILEDLESGSAFAKKQDGLFILAYNPMLFGILKKPAMYNVDILTCEGQPFGLPLAGGGPYLGILATHPEFVQYLPGRLVGQLMDLNGKKAYALIKEEREQHVSREKATSHICSNQAMQAIKATVYLATVGAQGLKEIATQNVINTQYFLKSLSGESKIKRKYSGPVFNEFVLDFGSACERIFDILIDNKIYCSKTSATTLQFAVTEMRNFAELDMVSSLIRNELAHV